MGPSTEAGTQPPGATCEALTIGPVRLEFSSSSPDFAALVRRRFALLRTPQAGEPGGAIVHISLRECPDGTVPEARLPERALFSCASGLRGAYDDGALQMAAPGVYAAARPAEGWARLTVSRGCLAHEPKFVTHTLVTFVLFELLRHRGLYHLHGAALVRGHEGLIVAGGTGSGKTTTAVSLVRRGWQCVADDTLFVRASDDSAQVYGLPEEFTLDPAATRRFPELLALRTRPPCGDGQKRSFDPREFYGDVFAQQCPAHVLVFSGLQRGGRTGLVRLSSAEALVRALPLSPLIMLDPSIAADHAAALRQLVQSCSCYALSAGPDLRREPWRLLEMLPPQSP